ncbi:imidazole glycerol phosphate synthase subunit HisH [Dermatophilus congolensis]|uniref:imidazole glycerol phosphate synthase subunit HisH n=1 Tax=Dermatophilus congolensis TaxID=1863 RepID=UPI001AAFF16B|nr:imidazole glycerol phosphate synthase subunit HisH [Dermatophilus congolensis]MBO3142361.1 imidazole glycerol phosphate synthase subunit HisH [Dermatophilus congolensis]MBO3151352.1 imidazole glycerol phosphate synthase subunit HisH [Dermatophilus congolensis]MBO3161644.1 imidazole glycerol phosphate synthase subunit HisH [Dermatophilus congolensis]MBO3162638.1 imidazole glycerol phosphate synthase subunit HisH [Dermatophilus congolensis]MBO3176191.1 imidazole glycerol phosphate synthase su
MSPVVAVLEYGVGDVRPVAAVLERVGARVVVTSDRCECQDADGLVVSGFGDFRVCMEKLSAVFGPQVIETRLCGGRSVLGIGLGMQVMFEGVVDALGGEVAGLGEWPEVLEPVKGEAVPRVGWGVVDAAEGSKLFVGVGGERFYFEHEYAAHSWSLCPTGSFEVVRPLVSWSDYGSRFVAAVENGPLVATQFYPESSGAAGEVVLRNWVGTLKR